MSAHTGFGRPRLHARLVRVWMPCAATALLSAPAHANLLRNGSFQDDWITLLPANKNHHWCYTTDYTNRRDYNPDAWFCSGRWEWSHADARPGRRRLVLHAPRAEAVQRVNWVFVHDDRRREGFPDAGGFPVAVSQRSSHPLALVRDLTLRVRVRGHDVPADAAFAELWLSPPGGVVMGDPLGAAVSPTVKETAPLPSGTYDWRWVEVKLAAARWLAAAHATSKDPKEAAEQQRAGVPLPGTVGVALRYSGSGGRLEVDRAELFEPGPKSPNLLWHGGFEAASIAGDPIGWAKPSKYRYFPPGHYYLFNTWHNAAAENRGFVRGDSLIARSGGRSLQVVVPSGDETYVASLPIVLNQREPRLVEVSAWVKTDRLNSLQIDAISEDGVRLDGFRFIHKAPVSIGTDEWRRIRQVFRPRAPIESLRLLLCARGVNGYTLEDTGAQPQNNASGTVWWDDVEVFEPESGAAELFERGVRTPPQPSPAPTRPRLIALDLGERLFGTNVLEAAVVNPGPERSVFLEWEWTGPNGTRGRERSSVERVAAGGRAALSVRYELPVAALPAYKEYAATLALRDADDSLIAASELLFSTWTQPIDLELGALYLRPDQTQLVRLNLGASAETLADLKSVRLDVIRRATAQVVASVALPADPDALAARRERIPSELRGDFSNLMLADLDVSRVPVRPFGNPERAHFVRATVFDRSGRVFASVDSAPFCRQAHDAKQPPVESVKIDEAGRLSVNGRPYMPWGAVYGHIPRYAGPADPGPGRYRDLRNLPQWSIYDGFTAATYTRAANDFNSARYPTGALSDPRKLESLWAKDNLFAATAFVAPRPVFSPEELSAAAGGEKNLQALLEFCKRAPMVVSVGPGIEEAFGLFQAASREQLAGLRRVVDLLRRETGKPVMVSHGGFWNRLEFEKVPFFDIYDPETEPLFPANVHTDLAPLVSGRPHAIWLRPQMYEDVPFERWRFHVYVELMRGVRGWQIAHGPGDASLFRGLHGELSFWKEIAASLDRGPDVYAPPPIEHWSRRHRGKTYLIAATTRGVAFGRWRRDSRTSAPVGGARVTPSAEWGMERDRYDVALPPAAWPSVHGIQHLPSPRRWPAGSRLVQWIKLDAADPARGLALLVKADGRWTHAGVWGSLDVESLVRHPANLEWFLRSFYAEASGFLGWNSKLVSSAAPYAPKEAPRIAALPAPGAWVKLELPLERIDAHGKLVDGVGFLHAEGRVAWGQTSLLAADGAETVVFGGAPSPERLARTRIDVHGLRAGTRIKVLFEDREIVAAGGYFVDDFRGEDLYQRFGGGEMGGYGPAPVALHLYEIP